MNAPYPYSPIVGRPPLRWPNGHRLAFWITPNIEYFRFGMPIAAQGVTSPSVSSYSARDYGNRVGVWRLMELLDRYGIRATAALNAEVCVHAPEIVDNAQRLGWELMGHGLTNSIMLGDLPANEQADHVQQTIEIIQSTTGTAPRGWLSAGLSESDYTLDHLIDNGIQYVCDWVADDQPFWMRPNGREIIAMPYAYQLNDIRIFSSPNVDPDIFVNIVKRTCDTLYREGSDDCGRVLAMSVHPFIIGLPHIIDALNQAIAYVLAYRDVWITTGGEIADWFRTQTRDAIAT